MQKKLILIASLGNTLEWFDFGLFIFFAPLIGEKFFPSSNPMLATLAALSVFAVGFICRPLGGILFGHVGDTKGRAGALRYSILVITLSTLLVGLLPDYQTLGLASPIVFVLLRLTQGLSVGGEYSGVMIYLAESAPSDKRGLITSFAASGANLGFLAATLVLMLLNGLFSNQEIANWAWRLPFIGIGLPGFLMLYFRFKLIETPTFLNLKKRTHLAHKPFLTALKDAPTALLKIFGLTCMSATLYYVFFGYMPTYLHQYLGIDNKVALTLQSICLISMLFLVPVAGLCGDYLGRKTMMIITTVGSLVLILPCFYLLQYQSIGLITIALAVATLLSSSDQGNSLCAVVENCPPAVRFSGIAFSYNMGMALFGGTAPLMITVLTQQFSTMAPAIYLVIMAGFSFIASLTLISKANKNCFFVTKP